MKTGCDEATKLDARGNLDPVLVLAHGEQEPASVRREIFVSNRRGLVGAYLKQHSQVAADESAFLNNKAAPQRHKISSLRDRAREVNERLTTLIVALQENSRLGERVITTYKRNKRDVCTEADNKQ